MLPTKLTILQYNQALSNLRVCFYHENLVEMYPISHQDQLKSFRSIFKVLEKNTQQIPILLKKKNCWEYSLLRYDRHVLHPGVVTSKVWPLNALVVFLAVDRQKTSIFIYFQQSYSWLMVCGQSSLAYYALHNQSLTSVKVNYCRLSPIQSR